MAISPAQSDFLNFTRWFAAWLVVAEHVRALVFAEFSTIQNAKTWLPFYFVTGFGHEAVMIFFVISGYLVGGKVWSSFSEGRFRWNNYFCDRLSRLYAVLIAAMFIGLAFDTIGLNFFNRYGQYTNTATTPLALVSRDFSAALQVSDFIAGLCFLQTVTSPTFGSNGPLWSLANEWWYYVLFPLALAVVHEPRWGLKFIALVILAALCMSLPTGLLVLGGVWLVGVIVSLIQRPLLPVWLSTILTAGALGNARLDLLGSSLVQEYAIGVTFAVLLNSMAMSAYRFPLNKLSFTLADFSYSLYLLHFPFVLLVVSMIHHYSGQGFKMLPCGESFALFFGIFVVAVAFSWLMSLITERRTSAIRSCSYRILGLERTPASVAAALKKT